MLMAGTDRMKSQPSEFTEHREETTATATIAAHHILRARAGIVLAAAPSREERAPKWRRLPHIVVRA